MKVIEPQAISPSPLPNDHPLQVVEHLSLSYGDLLILHGGKEGNEMRDAVLAYEIASVTRRQVILLAYGEKLEGITKKELKKLVT